MARVKKTRTNRGWRWLTAVGMCLSLVGGIVITEGAKAQNNGRRSESPTNQLAKYTIDLTAAIEQGRFSDIVEKTAETNRALEILADGQKNNPVLLTESQAVRDVVMIGVARRLAHGNVP